MSETRFVLVPEADLALLKAAEQTFTAMVEGNNLAPATLAAIFQPLYKLTHSNYRTAAYRPRRKG